MIDLTVAICTYNGEKRLPDVLERLRTQVDVENISWEIIVIDNNSTDETAKVVRNYQATQPQNCPIAYYFEPQQGLAFARQRAILSAKGKFVGFLDDDNLPTNNWVFAAHTFGKKHLKVGAYGSQIHAELEVEPPVNFDRIKAFLAIVERGDRPFIYEPEKKLLPPAAGLVVNRQIWLDNVPKNLFLKGRIGASKLASEDLEAVSYIQNTGWEIWYNPEMEIYHKIPGHRLEWNYLTSLVRGIGLARHHIRMIRTKSWQRPFVIPFYLANDLQRMIIYFIKNRKALKIDLAAACEMEFLSGSFLSPFYLVSKYWFDRHQKILANFRKSLLKYGVIN